ncbi:hypothetical protein EJ06DRAFT_482033 [Trichodelitschia bisporula]|uniref:BZIP domain-containing protein n=1 Tax=Trichodelitschia bisporula TaxID=703511 RepID=A0A6G1HMV2_9PEZI|nr:hypothetical protein EJ06DRAFT_482033 [Trichodelitschia bisporula]
MRPLHHGPPSYYTASSISSREYDGRPVSSGFAWPRGYQAPRSLANSDTNSSQHKSPLERLGFKLNIGGEKKTRADGHTPKRRGPKPDSKPALTRRQELNRQAQRTHRERKEMYIKALEQEVLRLKEVFEQVVKERDAFSEEVRRLREIIAAHGIHYDMTGPNPVYTASSQYGGSSTSLSGGTHTQSGASTGYTSPPSHPPPPPPIPAAYETAGPQFQQPGHAGAPGLDYNQIGIDFVLTLERPCMDHMQFLMVRSEDALEGEISGHALMATCPPISHVKEHPDDKYPHQMPDIGMADLVKLLDLSNRLPLDGEITPIMAWSELRTHPRYLEFTLADFEAMRDDLKGKVRCYGFGAVLEEFEVRDAIANVLTMKDNPMLEHTPAEWETQAGAMEDVKTAL